jgi:hypothetical protein
MAPFVKIVRISPDMKQINALLERIASALEAQNAMLGYAATAAPPDKVIADRTDEVNEELLAVVEQAEELGVPVPLETYKRLGIPAPGQRDEEALPDDWDEDIEGPVDQEEEVKSARRNI